MKKALLLIVGIIMGSSASLVLAQNPVKADSVDTPIDLLVVDKLQK